MYLAAPGERSIETRFGEEIRQEEVLESIEYEDIAGQHDGQDNLAQDNDTHMGIEDSMSEHLDYASDSDDDAESSPRMLITVSSSEPGEMDDTFMFKLAKQNTCTNNIDTNPISPTTGQAGEQYIDQESGAESDQVSEISEPVRRDSLTRSRTADAQDLIVEAAGPPTPSFESRFWIFQDSKTSI